MAQTLPPEVDPSAPPLLLERPGNQHRRATDPYQRVMALRTLQVARKPLPPRTTGNPKRSHKRYGTKTGASSERMVRLLSMAAPRRVSASSAETATKCRTGRLQPSTLRLPR